MIVMRKRTPLIFKARLAARGDMVSESDVAFASAQTTCRMSVTAVITVAKSSDLAVGSLDAAQAFLQSDTLNFADKQIAQVPGYIVMPSIETLVPPRQENAFGYK